MRPALALLREGEAALAPSPDARHDALALLRRALGLGEGLTALLEGRAEEDQAQDYAALLRRRAAGEPLQYILGEAYFMGLRFRVDERVLIPRQDTELLCELALARKPQNALELCAGSGAVSVALQRLSGCRMTATDISQDALDVARENALANGARLRLLQGDLFHALPERERFDLILCNPPYLSREDMERLQREVRREPALALYGGEDGLDFYRRLRQGFSQRLEEGGCLLLEVGQGQAQEVCGLFAPYATRVHADLNGIGRVVEVRALGRPASRDERGPDKPEK